MINKIGFYAFYILYCGLSTYLLLGKAVRYRPQTIASVGKTSGRLSGERKNDREKFQNSNEQLIFYFCLILGHVVICMYVAQVAGFYAGKTSQRILNPIRFRKLYVCFQGFDEKKNQFA